MHLLGIIDEVLDFSRLEAGRVAVARRRRAAGGARGGRARRWWSLQAEVRGVELVRLRLRLRGGRARTGATRTGCGRSSSSCSPTPSSSPRAERARSRSARGRRSSRRPTRSCEGPGPWVYVRVEDTGPGIPPERIAAIFEPFEQADMTLTRQHGGHGAGADDRQRLARADGRRPDGAQRAGDGQRLLSLAPRRGRRRRWTRACPAATGWTRPGARLLQDVRDAVLVELERVLHVYVARLRSDPATPARTRSARRSWRTTWPRFLVRPGGDVQRAGPGRRRATARRCATARHPARRSSERHGSQRRRLGWAETRSGASSRSCARRSRPPSSAACAARPEEVDRR